MNFGWYTYNETILSVFFFYLRTQLLLHTFLIRMEIILKILVEAEIHKCRHRV